MARVACPQSGYSTVGVNQRRENSEESLKLLEGSNGTGNAVSDRLSSAAIFR